MRIKNKKAVAGPLVDFYAYIAFALVIILFFLLFRMGAGQIKQEIKSDITDITATTKAIAALNQKQSFENKIYSTAELVTQVINQLIKTNKDYIDTQLGYESGKDPFLDKLDPFNKFRLSIIRPNLIGHPRSWKECKNNQYCYPILIIKENKKTLINFQPGKDLAAIAPINPEKTVEIILPILNPPLGDDKLMKITISETAPIKEPEHKKYYESQAPRRSAGTGSFPMGGIPW
jgi:hypothetical protein